VEVEELVQKAHRLGLAHKKQWLRLGHWRESAWWRGYRSEADGSGLFLSANGARDPEAELDATLRAFYAEASGDQHAVCKFPARLVWLHQELALPLDRIAQRECPKQQRFFESLAARSATVVFSAYYLGAPASAFGHTFLRINKQDPWAAEERRQLL